MLRLEIPKDIFARMVEQAKAEAPIETCGILAGSNRRVEKLYEMRNAEQRSDHFMMEPKEQFAVIKDIRSASLEMLAIYHSHPETPARLSAEDIRLALTTNVVYVILSLQGSNGPVVKGFCIKDNTTTEVHVKVVKR